MVSVSGQNGEGVAKCESLRRLRSNPSSCCTHHSLPWCVPHAASGSSRKHETRTTLKTHLSNTPPQTLSLQGPSCRFIYSHATPTNASPLSSLAATATG